MDNVTQTTPIVNHLPVALIPRTLSCVLWEDVSVISTIAGIKFMTVPWITMSDVEMEFVEKVVMESPLMDVLLNPLFTVRMETVSSL
jgi:hypothetical protein